MTATLFLVLNEPTYVAVFCDLIIVPISTDIEVMQNITATAKSTFVSLLSFLTFSFSLTALTKLSSAFSLSVSAGTFSPLRSSFTVTPNIFDSGIKKDESGKPFPVSQREIALSVQPNF